ncbi:DMT family transporter [Microvirga sp. W0021]|uniref:DMT family transporter n=1 Tax=Hohaiivirga grylli TaxID=3133970 RepID=A0ABV0BKG3_9HYPH
MSADPETDNLETSGSSNEREKGRIQIESHAPKGVLLLMIALFLFSSMDVTTKYLATRYEVPFIMAVRYIINTLLLVVMLTPTQGRQMVRVQRKWLVFLRGACIASGSLCGAWSMHIMQVAEATAIIFLAPIMVVLLASRILNETIGWLGWAAALVGFIGILLIVRPSGGLDPLGVFLALCACMTTVIYQFLSRFLVTTENTAALSFYAALIGAIGFGIAIPWTVGGPRPDPTILAMFIGTGIAGGIGHFLLTSAYRLAPASLLAPINYVQLLWSGILGWIVFGHIPDGITTLGMIVVALSGVLVTLKLRKS